MATVIIEGTGELKDLVKQKVATTDFIEITQQRIDGFAEITEDDQWIHVNVERARQESPYGQTIAHGFLTLSLFSTLFLQAIKIKGVRMGVNCGLNFVRFLAPITSGSYIRAHITLSAIEDVPGGVQATWGVTIETKAAIRPSCIAEWIVRYYS